MFASYSPSSSFTRSLRERRRVESLLSDAGASYLDLADGPKPPATKNASDSKSPVYYRRARSEPHDLPCAVHKSKVDVAAAVLKSAKAHKKKSNAARGSPRASPAPDMASVWPDDSLRIPRGYTGADSDCEMDARSDHYFASRESTPDADDISAEADALLAGMGNLGLSTSPFSACSAQAINTTLRLVEQRLQATLLLEQTDYRESGSTAHDVEYDADVRPAFIREDTPELAASPAPSNSSLSDAEDDMPVVDASMDDAADRLSGMSIFPKIPSLDEYTAADVEEIHAVLKSGPVPVQLLLDAIPICERAGWPEFPVPVPATPTSSPSRSQEAVAARRAEKRCKTSSAPYNTRARTRIPNPEYPLRPVSTWD